MKIVFLCEHPQEGLREIQQCLRFDGFHAGAGAGWGALCRRLCFCWCWHSSCRSGSGLAGTQLLFQGVGWGKGMFWTEPSSPCALQLCLDRATARLQVAMKGVLCATGKWCVSPGGGWDLRWPSGPCPAPCADGCAFSKELVANLQLLASFRAAFTTRFGLTTGMKKMEIRDEPTAGGTLGNPSVAMGRSVLPMICEFICFENTLSVTVPMLHRDTLSKPKS